MAVVDNDATSRFELTDDGKVAFLVYKRTPETLELIHTEVPEELRGRHLGDALVEFAFERAHAEHLRVVAICPFVRAYLRKRGRATI
jgi:predicted GNAT family acetyltransferase